MKQRINNISGGINAVKGYRTLGVSAGIKKSKSPDLALILCENPSLAAGVFTKNRIYAAPLKVAKSKIGRGAKKLILINSGNANACTGKKGIDAVHRIEGYTARTFGVKEDEVLSSSTGIIGVQMPVDKILKGIDLLKVKTDAADFTDGARAIMTTDTFPKEAAVEVDYGDGCTFRIGGIVKGAGMIAPYMATMLAFIVTDLQIERKELQRILRECTEKTFNRITIDGDMSTNDTVLCLGKMGKDGNAVKKTGSKILDAFKEGLMVCMDRLSRMIVKDGEGATKIIEVEVVGALSDSDAKKVASKIANSNLFKCAVHGESANWGRIMAAAGASGAMVKEEKIDIVFGKIKTVCSGQGLPSMDSKVKNYLKGKNISIKVNLNLGFSSCSFLTCDMTPEYVKINADYS